MKTWLFLLVGVVIAAGAAFGVRHYGFDIGALVGLTKDAAPARPRARPSHKGGKSPIAGPQPSKSRRPRHHN